MPCSGRRSQAFAKALLLLSLVLTARRIEAVGIMVNDSSDQLHGSAGECALTGTGTCTLRDAITFANSNPGQDNIFFQFSVTTVTVGAGGLPAITEAVALNGDIGAGRVTVDGMAAGAVDGLTLSGNGSTIKAIQIVSFGGSGISITGDSNTVGGCGGMGCIGGQVTISGNSSHGILISGGSSNVVQGCTIELNGGDGVRLSGGAAGNSIGGFPVNDIHGNTGAGVRVGTSDGETTTTGNVITASMISGNGGLGIDLGAAGASTNDNQDADTGPNGLQNVPVLTTALSGPGYVQVTGSLNSTPNTALTLRFSSSAAADPSGFGEGDAILGSLSVTTDALGDAGFTTSFPASLQAGTFLSATATSALDGTSEFSQSLATAALPAADFYTVPPCRVLDTRDAPGAYGGPALTSNELRTVALAGQCSIPSDAQAVSLNVTAIDPAGPGFLRLFPAQSLEPPTSTLNFSAGQTRANNAILPLFSGSLSIRALVNPAGTVHCLIDVNGYFR